VGAEASLSGAGMDVDLGAGARAPALAEAGQLEPVAATETPILRMAGVTKRFPGTLALDGVDLTVRRGEIHALLGQNGAGKSTLVKILAGDYAASEGEVRIDGQLVAIRNTRDAMRLGIGIVYQELSLLPNLTVAENMYLGREPGRAGRGGPAGYVDRRALRAEAGAALADLGLRHIDPEARAGWLSLPERQLVEIAKVLARRPRLLILDEPTAALAQGDAERLFAVLRALKGRDIGIIYITHRFREVLSLCDRGTILRNGRVARVVEMSGATMRDLVEATLGQASGLFYEREGRTREEGQRGERAVAVRGLSVGDRIRDVSFDLYHGEIVGICGLLGAGQNELARSIFGDQPGASGAVEVHGRPVTVGSPRRARRLGIGFISDNRREEGIIPDMPVRQNISIAALGRVGLSRFAPFIGGRAERRASAAAARETGVREAALPRPIRLLSGGNQQKALLARWLMRDSDIFVFIEPTRGVDIGARREIYGRLEALADGGRAVLVVSTDIAEVLGLADRIVVMHEGALTDVMAWREATEERIALAMQGHARGPQPQPRLQGQGALGGAGAERMQGEAPPC